MEPLVDPAVVAARAHLEGVAAELGLVGSPEVETPQPTDPYRPLVTVVVPVFNDDRFVADALRSVQQQTYPDWECVVVDDCSTDSSLAAISSVVTGDSRFQVMSQSWNRGPAAARNRAIAVARGEYVAFLDGDDLMLPYSLEDRIDAIRGHVGDRFVTGSYSGARFGAEETKIGDFPERQRVTLQPFVDFVIADGECPFTIIAPLVATETVRAVSGFDERMRSGAADWDLWHRILRNGHVFVACQTVGAVYRQNSSGQTRTHPAEHTRVAAGLIAAANRRYPVRALRQPTPYPMCRPIGHYRMLIEIARRAVRFAAMALVDGKPEEMASTLSVLKPGSWPLLQRHLSIAELVKTGAARTLGVSPGQLDGELLVLLPFVTRLKMATAEASS